MNTTEILKRLQATPIVRTMTADRSAIDEGKRTARLAFASDKPIEHWFGKLKLSMDKKSMRSERLRSGAPLLMDHESKDQIGIIESHSIGSDGIARATVRFSRSARGEEIFQDVKDGIRTNVSVGFMVHDLQLESEGRNGELPTYRSMDWEPFEVSIVSVPADISAGVGRSAQNVRKINKMSEENLNSTEEIVAFAEIFGEGALARQMVLADENVTHGDVRLAIRAKQQQENPTIHVPPISARDQAVRQGGIYQPATIASRVRLQNFTGEGAEERAYRFGSWLLGGPMGNSAARDICQRNGWMIQRAQSEGVNEKGGYLVPEEFGNDLVNLIEQYGVFRRNAKSVPMASDTRSDPRITGRLTAAFVNESTAGTNQDMTFDRISLTAKKTMVTIPFSSEVSEDATASIGDILAGEAARAFAEKEDNCGFIGDGGSTYGGMEGVTTKIKALSGTIANIAGLVVATGTGYASSYGSTVLTDFEAVAGKLPVYADTPNAKWYVHKSYYYNVMLKLLAAAGGATATELEDLSRRQRFLGYPVEFVQVLPSIPAVSQVCVLLGDLAQAASFGDRRKFTVSISDQIRFYEDDWVLKATSRWDINVHDVGNASATAGSRVAGPIVGLITAAS